jgi:hypothetical protein
MDIALGTTVTLNGVGVYIFRSAGALTTGADSFVVLAGGASASDVFWAPVGATTLGAYTTGGIPPVTPTFVGNILDAAGITFGNFASLLGRAFAFGGTVTMDSNTLVVPSASSLATLHVIKVVSNSNGVGTAVSSDFSLHVKTAGADVAGSPLVGVVAPGTTYTLSADTYVVSEDVNVSYTQVFSGDCDASGSLTLLAGDDKTCTITNTDIPAPVPAPIPVPVEAVGRSGGGGGSQRITPIIGVSKIPNPLSLPLGQGMVTYNYVVWNIGGRQAMIDVAVNDDKCSPLLLISGDSNSNDKLDIDERWNYSCATVLSTTTTNTVFAYGYSDDGYHQSATANAVATVEVGVSYVPTLIQNSIPVEYQEVGGVLVSDPFFPDTGMATKEEGSPKGLLAFILGVVGVWILSGIVIRGSRI